MKNKYITDLIIKHRTIIDQLRTNLLSAFDINNNKKETRSHTEHIVKLIELMTQHEKETFIRDIATKLSLDMPTGEFNKKCSSLITWLLNRLSNDDEYILLVPFDIKKEIVLFWLRFLFQIEASLKYRKFAGRGSTFFTGDKCRRTRL